MAPSVAMTDTKAFPPHRKGELYLTEGGVETELMYKWGVELPHFSTFPLINNRDAMSTIRGIFHRYLDVAAKYQLSALISGLDYRASPDWGALLGYSPEALADATIQSVEFSRELAQEYAADIPHALTVGTLGPRGDAYELNKTITADEAENYHAVQLETLKKANVDIAWGMTFNTTAEAIGATRAAEKVGLPFAVSLSIDSTSKLNSGPSFADAVEIIEAETNGSPAFYFLNCSHPIEFEPALTPGDWINRVRGFRPNASKMEKIALCQLGHLEEGNPVELGQMIGDVARRYPHMDIWGGCCGTGEVHLEEMVKNILDVRQELATEPAT